MRSLSCSPGNSAKKLGPLFSNHRRKGSNHRSRSNQMEKVMTSQSSNTRAQTQLSDNELNAVIGGHQKFHYEEMNGHTYAIGHINGRTVAVRVD